MNPRANQVAVAGSCDHAFQIAEVWSEEFTSFHSELLK
jgi:hypothetical protein